MIRRTDGQELSVMQREYFDVITRSTLKNLCGIIGDLARAILMPDDGVVYGHILLMSQ